MTQPTIRIRGQVNDQASHRGLAGLRVEAWDNGRTLDQPLAAAVTGADGGFDLAVDAARLRETAPTQRLAVSFRVFRDQALLRDTKDAVTWTWATRQKPVQIDVAVPEAEPASPAPPEEKPPVPPPAVVRGRLTYADGKPVAGASVRAFDRELRSETPLGQAATDKIGAYTIGYDPGTLSRPDKHRADLVVRAFGADGKEIAASAVIIGAPAGQTVDLVFGNAPYRGPAEYTRLREALAPYLGQADPASLTADEIAYLAAKTGFDASLITQVAAAERLAGQINLPAAVFYGLLRQGLPAGQAALLRRDRRAVERALQAALDANIIPQAVADPTQVTSAFQRAAVAQVFEAPAEPGAYSLGDLLATSSLSRAQQESLALRAAQHEGPRAEFWAGLRADPAYGESLVADVQFSLHVGQVTGNYVPLVRYLQAQRRGGKLAGARDLARLDLPAWQRLLTTRQNGQVIGAPAGTPGQTEDERIKAYAARLAGAFQRRYPTAALAGHLARTAEPAQADLVRFLDQNPEFDLGATSVAAFVPGSNLAGIPDITRLTAELKRTQRIFRLMPIEQRIEGTPALLDAGLTSARSITRYGKDRFVKTLAPAVGGAAVAAQIYDNAAQTAAGALAVYTKYVNGQASPWALGAIPAGPADIPDWETLFGPLDSCGCEHCQSVYSPAAYLVDLLAFLDQYAAVPGPLDVNLQPTALDRLLRRRPDLGEIELTCANTDTLMPYVDLAIEVFENAVAGTTNPYQTSWTAAELNANAEHINPVAYDRDHLAGQVYPFELPFNLWLAEGRIFLEHLGLSLDQLMDTFQPAPANGRAALERAGEHLRLTPLARRVITGVGRQPLAELWGLTGDPVAQLSDVPTFLKQSGLTYEQLLELLDTHHVNPMRGTIIIHLPDPGDFDPTPGLPGPGQPGPKDPPDPGIPVQVEITISFVTPCTLEGARLNRLTAAALGRIQRFLRLQRALGWTIRDLDRVLVALGAAEIDEAFLVRLADVKLLLPRFGLPLDELLSWWANIATTVYAQDTEQRSLYERLFLNNAVLNPPDPAFALKADATELLTIGRLSEHVPALVAALEIDAEELDLLLAASVTDDTLNLANLSQLYRTVSLARALGLGIAEFLSARALTGIDPFDGGNVGQTRAFIERVEQIEASPFSIAELDYLLRHVYDPAGGIGLSDEQVGAAIETLRSGLGRVVQDYPPLADPTGVITQGTLALLLPAADVPTAMAILAGTSTLGIAEQTTFVETSFAAFLDPAEAVARLVDPGELAAPQARYAYVLNAARRYLARLAGQALIAQQIAVGFGLDLGVAQALLSDHLPAARDALLALADSTDPAVTQAASLSYLRLHKIALVLGKLHAGLEDLPWLFGEEYDFGWYDLARLPASAPTTGARRGQFATENTENAEDVQLNFSVPSVLSVATYTSWARLVEVFAFRDRFPVGETTLFDLLATGYTSTAADEAAVWDAVAAYTNWPRGEIETLAGTAGLGLVVPDDYRDERYLLRLERAFNLLGQIGMPAAAVVTWRPTDDTEAMQLTAQGIKQAARAKYDEATWLTVAPSLKDALREQQRATLVAYLVATMAGIDRPSDLFEHFLIDGEMDACMDTSRIKQAISSVQLFVQRCLMGLERDIQLPAEAATQWEWMQQYRLWEAARKIFLYPENWIEPDLRDDMTPFFEDLSGELRQSALTDESAATALRHYLEQLDLVDRLEVRSLYHQLETADDGTPIDRLHVLARTQNEPYTHFYRQRVDDAYWTAWEPVNIGITGSHEFLVMHEGTLYLFMPALDLNQDDDIDLWTIVLQWSTYQQGQWTAPRKAANALTFEAPRTEEAAYFYFKAVTDGDDLLIIPLWHEDGGPTGSFTGDDYIAFRMRCGEKVEIDEGPYTYTIEVQPETRLNAMTLIEEESADAPLALFWTDAGLGEAGAPYQDEVTVLENTPGLFQILLPHQYDYFVAQDAFFYHGITRVFHVQPVWSRLIDFETIPAVAHPVVPTDDRPPTTGGADVVTTDRRPPTTAGSRDGGRRSGVGGRHDPVADVQTARSDPLIGAGSPLDGVFNGTPQQFELEKKLRFTTFHHPYICDFTRRLSQGGVPALLQRETQSQSSDYFADLFDPNTDVVSTAYPVDQVEFGYGGAYSIYNEELFFHAPLLIAERLRQNQRFAEAQRWYHYVFNPLAGANGTGPAQFWNYQPFYLETSGETTLDLMLDLANGDYTVAKQVEQWRSDPFQPHALARLRPQAYQKMVVMKYVQNLIDWGDQLFTQDTIETINEATQLYVLAANILGDKPEPLPAAETAPKTFNTLRDGLDAFSNALVELENYIAEPAVTTTTTGNTVPALTLYFCIPPNDTMLALWDTVADRLFKIRHCMNIAGAVRQLPLWEPPIDPGLLVRAAALGVDLSTVLAGLYAPLPHYRFQVMLQKALELCNEVRSLGAALLAALEKQDAEALALLRAGHETQLLEAIRQVREWQVDEADEARQALERAQEVVLARQEYYAELLAAGWNEYETKQQDRMNEAMIAQIISQGLYVAASSTFAAAVIAKEGTLQLADGLDLAGKASQAAAQASGAVATYLDYRATLNALLGNHERRKEEWGFQLELATKELEQIARQILAAEIRHDIAQRELENHDIQIANAQATSALLQSKFTNEALYGWMVSQIAPIYFTSYQMACDLARRAEQAYRHELGLVESSFIGYGYWDNLKQGLLSGEKLASDLRRLEVAYLDANKREYELTRHVSLAMLDPTALLLLKQTGECYFSLPEAIFDLDFPGQYLRRIKSVSLTLPCVTGPYTGVSATLTLLGNRIRRETGVAGGYTYTGLEDTRFQHNTGAIQSIATSSAQHDSGLFELNFRDERYLPFEGAGVISDWRLELPRTFRQFDYDTISDAIVHVRYTARDGGTALRQSVEAQLADALNTMVLATAGREGLDRLFSLRHEFPNEWYRLLYPAGDGATQAVTLPLSVERFPFVVQDRAITIDTVELFVKVTPAFAGTVTAETLKLGFVPGSQVPGPALTGLTPWNGLLRAETLAGGTPGDWTLALWLEPGGVRQPVAPEAIEEVVLICHYTIR